MGCSQSTSLKTVMETRPLEPDIAEPLTERPSKPRQNSAVKQDDNLEVSNIRSPSDQGEESKKFSPLKHENSDGGMVSASPDIRQNQTLKQANKSGFLNMSCTKVPSKLR
jgi:hypothetical protein